METHLTTIKDLSVADRPREKMLSLGPAGLSDLELIAVILGSGSKALPLFSICRSLLEAVDNNIHKLASLNIEKLSEIKGIGTVKAITLLAAIELGKRSLKQTGPLLLKEDKHIQELLAGYLTNQKKIQYHLVMLNNRQELLATSALTTAKGKLPYMPAIIKLTLEAGASEIIICRNEVELPEKFCNEEKAFIIELDAAASMLKINMRGILIILTVAS
jgi:DNA repair protein RadC